MEVSVLAAAGVGLDLLQIGRENGVTNRSRVIEVVIGGGGHRQNSSCVGVHYNAKSPFPGLIGADPFGQGLLTVTLNGSVNGELKVETGLPIDIGLIAG